MRFRKLVRDYIGGGWGKDEIDEQHSVEAAVIRGTDIPRVLDADFGSIPVRYHKQSNVLSRALQVGDIVYEVSGGSKDQPVGRSLLITERLLETVGERVIPASFCKRIVVDEAVASPDYVEYVLRQAYRSRQVMRWQTQSTGISNFAFEAFLDEFEVDLPALPVQKRRATMLAAFDSLIANNRRRIRLLEDMARAMYRHWFIDFQYPGHDRKRAIGSSDGYMPAGWPIRPVMECVQVNPRVVIPKEGNKPFVPMTSLANDSMLISDIESRTGNSGAKFQNGDTLFARITPCLENGKTGYVQFLPDESAVAFGSTEFIVLRSKTLSPEFVYLLARSSDFRENAIKSMTGASGRQRVQEACFNGFMIPQPPDALVKQFSQMVRPMFRLIQTLHLAANNLNQARDMLLPRCLSGEEAVSLPERFHDPVAGRGI